MRYSTQPGDEIGPSELTDTVGKTGYGEFRKIRSNVRKKASAE